MTQSSKDPFDCLRDEDFLRLWLRSTVKKWLTQRSIIMELPEPTGPPVMGDRVPITKPHRKKYDYQARNRY